MRYRVIKSFLDKNTRKPYNADYFYETDNEARASELIAGGYIIPLGNAAETNASESDTENNAAAETAAESDEAKKKTAKK